MVQGTWVICLGNQVFLVQTNVRSYIKPEGCLVCITYLKLHSGQAKLGQELGWDLFER